MAKPSGKVGLIELRVGTCLSGPTKRLVHDLHDIALEANRARNAIMLEWVLWHRAHPDYKTEPVLDENNQPKLTATGKPVLTHAAFPSGMRNDLYAVATRAAPRMAAMAASCCVGEVCDWLTGKMPWNHPGKARFRWQAVLWNEIQPPTAISLSIPLHNRTISLCCAGVTRANENGKLAKRLHKHGDSGACVAVGLFSRESGRQTQTMFRIERRQLSMGNRRLIGRITDGTWPHRDSEIVFKPGSRPGTGRWSLQLCYHRDVKVELDVERQAVLVPQDGKASHPFVIRSPEGKEWRLGDVEIYRRETVRHDARRAAIRHSYQNGDHQGHGRRNVYRSLGPGSRALRGLYDRFTKRLVSEAVKFCERHNCGRLLYDEPSLPKRRGLWFEGNNLRFDWTKLASLLGNAEEVELVHTEKPKKKSAG